MFSKNSNTAKMTLSYLHQTLSKHTTKNEALFNLAAMLGHSSNVTTTWGVDTTASAQSSLVSEYDNSVTKIASGGNAL